MPPPSRGALALPGRRFSFVAMGFFERLKTGLSKTRQGLLGSLGIGVSLDPAQKAELEAALLAADLGARLSAKLLESVQASAPEDARAKLLQAILQSVAIPDANFYRSPKLAPTEVLLLLGVNGSGKTTSCAKIAGHFRGRGEKVLMVAADTFRAAAVEQLRIWSERSGSDFFSQGQDADPASVAFDGVSKGRAGAYDRVIIDTAGRLQSKSHLMEELSKIRRVCAKALPGAPHRSLLVLDGSTGQNMLSQARLFHEAVPLSGLIVTKLDGSSRAGALLAVMEELKVPVLLVGVGEGMEDLQEFVLEDFARALLEA